jgi:hypothetical protein
LRAALAAHISCTRCAGSARGSFSVLDLLAKFRHPPAVEVPTSPPTRRLSCLSVSGWLELLNVVFYPAMAWSPHSHPSPTSSRDFPAIPYDEPRSIAYVTLEYCEDDLFSGNGVCARSHVRGIAARGVSQYVIAGRPAGAPAPQKSDSPPGVSLSCIPLDVWRTTDRYASHDAFARGAAEVLERLVHGSTAHLDAIMLVDWTGAAAVDAMSLFSTCACTRV